MRSKVKRTRISMDLSGCNLTCSHEYLTYSQGSSTVSEESENSGNFSYAASHREAP
ncbi:hypothetical protein WN55_09044 [Dufourea novaeangliae]|uniref:Uncharacterized protein n=1 Tax=Dufourea novaeangliae TaxID=178035 RepID=A0A154P811_DUFNO|nr:hypothetical protein WN55_09044 [Dufourea novaeangliae]